MSKKQSKMLSITVGIPAYNEESNIGGLLDCLLDQKVNSGRIEKILVVADGCSDETVNVVKKYEDRNVDLVVGRVRMGQSERQNQIFEKSDSDVVVLLNADILPVNNFLIEELVKPFSRYKKLGLVGGRMIPVGSSSLVGRIVDWSVGVKFGMYEKINGGETIYLCHGPVRAFSKPVYRKLRWTRKWSEDAYSYLFTKKLGFDFLSVNRALVYFKSPQELTDQMRQSRRFVVSRKGLVEEFGAELIAREYKIPFLALVHAGLEFVRRPTYGFAYLGLLIAAKVQSFWINDEEANTNWKTASTTKHLTIPSLVG